MADDTLKPMTVEDIAAATGDTLQPSDPLKNGAGAAATGSGPNDTAGSDNADAAPGGGAKQVIADNVAKLRSETGDRARTLLEDGKGRATSALDQLSQMLQDAATQVDEKLGSQYGQYARDAADKVQGFSSTLNERDIDELLEDARELVRKSPGAAIGTAAAVGFVIARLLSAGLDQRDKA